MSLSCVLQCETVHALYYCYVVISILMLISDTGIQMDLKEGRRHPIL